MQINKFLLFVLFLFWVIRAGEMVAYEDSTFIVKTKLQTTQFRPEIIRKQLEIIKNVLIWTKNPVTDSLYPQTLFLSYDDVFGSDFKGKFGYISFKPEYQLKSYYAVKSAREPTIEERNYFTEHKYAISPSIVNVKEEDAIKIAKAFFHKLLFLQGMQNDLSVYDTIAVSYGADRYIIKFKAKRKNYIPDSREAEIAVSPLNGQILRFHTPMGLVSNRDLNYKPEVSFEKVNEIIVRCRGNGNWQSNKFLKLILTPSFLKYNGWVWVLIDRKVSPPSTSKFLIIDSNTGEVLYNDICP